MITTIHGLQIHYDIRGEGAPVLLLHGWGASIQAMLPIANYLVSIGRKAITFDFPGFGESEMPKEPWGVPEYAELTLAFMKEMQLEGCDLICHSFGGRVTILLASEHPNLFQKLVLVDAAGIRPKRGLKYYYKVYSYKLGKRMKKIAWLNRLFRLEERQKNAGSIEYRSLPNDVMRQTFSRVVNLDLTPKLKSIKNPTLLIWGTNDQDTPLYMAEMMEKHIPDAGLVMFEGAGHFSYADQYQRFCVVIKAFLTN